MLKRIEDPNEYSLETALEAFYSIAVELKQASATIQAVNESFPIDTYRHLKRIKRIQGADHVKVLLCPLSACDKTTIVNQLTDLGLPSSVETVQVPIRQPVTKQQYEKWNSLWPVVFHESTYERLKTDELFHFTKLLSMYKSTFSDSKLTLLIVENQLTDPDTKVDDSLVIFKSDSTENHCPADISMYPFDHLVLKTINREPLNSRIIRKGKIPYLLSGCVAILAQEPCTMCSMGLLHSRIDAVIYFESNPSAGALGSICLLHSEPSLNHHFPVFKVTLE